MAFADILPILKELYPDGINNELIYKRHPLLGMLSRDEKFGGKQQHIPVRTGKPQGRSATFSTAQTNAFTSVYKAFDVTRKNDYGVIKIDGESVDLATSGDTSVLIYNLQAEIDGVISSMGDNLAKMAYRSSSGSRGTVGSGTASPITLANPEDVYFFEQGDVLSANDSDDTTTPRSGTGVITVVDEDAGTITYTGTITSIAAGDFLFVAGDEGLAWSGLGDWVPSSAPTSTLYYNVDRSGSPNRLGGIRFDGRTYGHEEFFIRFAARLARTAVKPDYYMVNPKDFANFQAAASGQREIASGLSSYNYGFEAISAYNVKIVQDADCPVGQCWAVDLTAFWLSSLGEAPRIINQDGLKLLRAATSDAYELRAVSRGNFISDAPGLLARGQLPT